MKKFCIFLGLAYISAFIFEEIPRLALNEINLWQMPNLWFFFVWYGFLFTVAYFLFANRPIKHAVAFGIIIGMLAETFLFHKMNLVSVFIFPVLYGLMFYLPFKLSSRFFH